MLECSVGIEKDEFSARTETVAVFWLDTEPVMLIFVTRPVRTSLPPTNRSSATSIRTGSLLIVIAGPPADTVIPSRITLLGSTTNSSVPMLMVWAAGADVSWALHLEVNANAMIEMSDS